MHELHKQLESSRPALQEFRDALVNADALQSLIVTLHSERQQHPFYFALSSVSAVELLLFHLSQLSGWSAETLREKDWIREQPAGELYEKCKGILQEFQVEEAELRSLKVREKLMEDAGRIGAFVSQRFETTPTQSGISFREFI